MRTFISILGVGELALLLSLWSAPASWAGPQPGDTELFVSGGTEYDGAQFSVLGIRLLPTPGLE